METLVDAFKTHKMWFVIGGAGFLGILAYAFLHKSSSSNTQQDLLVASQPSGPSPVTGTTQTTIDPGNIITPGIPGTPADSSSPPPFTPITAIPGTPASPISPGGLATPNLPADQPPSLFTGGSQPMIAVPAPGSTSSIQTANPVQPAAPAQLTQSYAISPPQVFGSGIAPQVTNPQSPAAVKALTAASTPNYVGTPLGPGTPVISGPSAAAQTRTTATSGGQPAKVVPQGAKVFGVGISPNSTR